MELWKRENDQINQFWEEQRGTIGYYLSALERGGEKCSCGVCLRTTQYRKWFVTIDTASILLYALTTGIVSEYDLKTCVVKDWFPSYLKYGTDHLNKTFDCVKRWPRGRPSQVCRSHR